MKKFLPVLLIFCLSTVYGQTIKEYYSLNGIVAEIHYGVETPMGILSERFGTGFSIGVTPTYISKKQWLFGLKTKFLFGAPVKEDVLANLRTEDGQIIGQNKTFGTAVLNQRGYFIGGTFGKLIALNESGRSSLRVAGSAGILRHKIRIDAGGNLPQLSGSYRAGYDRLTFGPSLTEFVGYQYVSKNRLINMYAGVEFTQGFTKNRRTVNYDTGLAETGLRQDNLWNIQVGWILSLYDAKSKDDFY